MLCGNCFQIIKCEYVCLPPSTKPLQAESSGFVTLDTMLFRTGLCGAKTKDERLRTLLLQSDLHGDGCLAQD